MHLPHIALIGKARAGKDTVAQILTREYAYTRLAFADELKRAALRTNPIIPDDPQGGHHARLADLVEQFGWEWCKDRLPEVRRYLQATGVAMRDIDPRIWIRPVERSVEQGTRWNMPCVVTDTRFNNEVETLTGLGAITIRITRPGTGSDTHVSETELDDYKTNYTIVNAGTLEDLGESVRNLVRRLA